MTTPATGKTSRSAPSADIPTPPGIQQPQPTLAAIESAFQERWNADGVGRTFTLPRDFLAMPVEDQVLLLINMERGAQGVGPVRRSTGALASIAKEGARTLDMNHGTHGSRIQAVRGTGGLAGCDDPGEINAGLMPSAATAVFTWMYRDAAEHWGHRAKLLAADQTYVGIGSAPQQGKYGLKTMFCANFVGGPYSEPGAPVPAPPGGTASTGTLIVPGPRSGPPTTPLPVIPPTPAVPGPALPPPPYPTLPGSGDRFKVWNPQLGLWEGAQNLWDPVRKEWVRRSVKATEYYLRDPVTGGLTPTEPQWDLVDASGRRHARVAGEFNDGEYVEYQMESSVPAGYELSPDQRGLGATRRSKRFRNKVTGAAVIVSVLAAAAFFLSTGTGGSTAPGAPVAPVADSVSSSTGSSPGRSATSDGDAADRSPSTGRGGADGDAVRPEPGGAAASPGGTGSGAGSGAGSADGPSAGGGAGEQADSGGGGAEDGASSDAGSGSGSGSGSVDDAFEE